MSLIKNDEFERYFLKEYVLLFEHTIAGDKENWPFTFFFLGDFSHLLLIVQNNNFTERRNEVLIVFESPVLH